MDIAQQYVAARRRVDVIFMAPFAPVAACERQRGAMTLAAAS